MQHIFCHHNYHSSTALFIDLLIHRDSQPSQSHCKLVPRWAISISEIHNNICTFVPAQSYDFKKLKVYETKQDYAGHHNLLLITNRSWILTIYKYRIFWKNFLENKETVFKNGVINIQAVSYKGVRTKDGLKLPTSDMLVEEFSFRLVDANLIHLFFSLIS